MKNIMPRRILLGLYFIFGLVTSLLYIPVYLLQPRNPSIKPTMLYISLDMLMLLFGVISLAFYITTILVFHYRAKYLLLFFLPFVGGLGFAIFAFIDASKREAKDFELNSKIWSFLVLLGLYGLYQSAGGLFTLWAFKAKLQPWQSTLDLLFFAATIFYFIYWGRNRKVASWSLKNLWSVKWMILLGIVLMIAWGYAYPAILGLFHTHLPVGANQTGLNNLAKNTPIWLMWLHLAIGAPVIEETIFRAGIYELISPKHPKIAFFVSASSFASIHMMNSSFTDLRVWGVYLGMAFILSGIYYKTRKIEATAAIHFLWNGVFSFLLP